MRSQLARMGRKTVSGGKGVGTIQWDGTTEQDGRWGVWVRQWGDSQRSWVRSMPFYDYFSELADAEFALDSAAIYEWKAATGAPEDAYDNEEFISQPTTYKRLTDDGQCIGTLEWNQIGVYAGKWAAYMASPPHHETRKFVTALRNIDDVADALDAAYVAAQRSLTEMRT